jgi:threonine dehydratase
MKNRIPTAIDVEQAHRRIKGYIHRTPTMQSQSIDKITGSNIVFKCENFQKVGAFKFRGAINTALQLNNAEIKNGLATHSSGNHAAAVALAATQLKIPAYIVMPENAPVIKQKAVKEYGGIIQYCKPTLKARESGLEDILRKTGAFFIHPYNHFNIICGQGTASKEALEDAKTAPDYVVAPVGGGGLLSGTAVYTKSVSPSVKVIGAEPSGADDARQSLQEGRIIPSINPYTIADGLLTSLGELTFKTIKRYVDEIMPVDDPLIVEAMRMIWERMKIIIEPSAAIGLAIVLKYPDKFKNKKVLIILSGGNVDICKLPFK